MAGTEGLGGPCPRCGEMNCYIKKGTGTWYTFIACTDCYFAYGEHADSMMEETGGVVTGASVWSSVISNHRISSPDEIYEMELEEDDYAVSSPFGFSNHDDKWLDLLVTDKYTIEMLTKAVENEEEIKN